MKTKDLPQLATNITNTVLDIAFIKSNETLKEGWGFGRPGFNRFVRRNIKRRGINWVLGYGKEYTKCSEDVYIIVAPIMDKTITTYSITWGSPYTTPPSGAPSTLIWEFLEHNVDRNELSEQLFKKARKLYPELKKQLALGGGYDISVNFDNVKIPVVRSAETILKMRKQRTLKKLEKQTPLFLEDEYQKILLEKASYFNIDIIKETQKQKLATKLKLWNNDFNEPNQLRHL